MTPRLVPTLLLAVPLLARANPEAEAAAAEAIVPVLVTGAMLATAITIVAMVLYARHRAAELRHATIRLALEKGQAIPPALLAGPQSLPEPARDLRRGLQLVGLGAGLGLFLLTLEGARVAAGAGLIPLLLGLGHLVSYRLAGRARTPAGAPDPIA